MDTDEMTPIAFFFTVSMQETLQTMRETPELQKYAEQLEDFDIVDRERKIFRRSAGEAVHVLNHGDMWINNVFFSFNEKNEPNDAILV